MYLIQDDNVLGTFILQQYENLYVAANGMGQTHQLNHNSMFLWKED
jgi:hypothetical protein